MKNLVKKYIEKYPNNYSQVFKVKESEINIKKIINLTSFLIKNESFGIRMKCVLNDITNYPTCINGNTIYSFTYTKVCKNKGCGCHGINIKKSQNLEERRKNIQKAKNEGRWGPSSTKIKEVVLNGYKKLNQKLEDIEIYDLNKTIHLLKDNYKDYFGKSGNRKLIKDDIRLYKSVKKHSEILHKKTHSKRLRFSGELIFLIEYDGNMNNLKCEYFDGCGYFISFNPVKKIFPKKCGSCFQKLMRNTELPNLKLYKQIIYNLSNKNYRKYEHLINIDVVNRGRNEYHLDHIYTISDGFINNIPPFIMSSIVNLQLITESQNLSKGSSSDITKEELFKRFYDKK